MTGIGEAPSARPVGSAGPGRSRRTPKQRKRLAWNTVLQVLAMLAIGLLVYPQAASWVARIGHNSEISGYVDRVAQTPDAERQAILDAAYAYNDTLEPGSLTDPYISQNPDEAARSTVYRAYEQLLRVSGTNAIGTLSYPRLDIGLPIYHGTADSTISRGVGHMFGTSMPVGGPSTHSVLTSHSGLPQSRLFTDLLKAKVGDEFWISVLGEDHYYRVESVETVLPEDASFEIVEGEDWVTLFTCAPIGVNSHRFLVHAVRIPGPEAQGGQAIAGDGMELGFPWWAAWFVAGSGAVGWFLFAPPRKKRRGPDPAPGGAQPGPPASAEPGG